ncbi:helix-turn-helix domain-containing protein [Chryseobacterium foetidum]|uniref:helix-turn-helix domain-containing protein n=1 Tax=Chryseobacterium foetidum TaxID=2951057 RepID=UPI0021C89476|nr:helix-turn-helix domain-containing protein [Chryseobacterium foetidum]
MKNPGPNYKLIFSDILDLKYPEKRIACTHLLEKEDLSTLDIIKLNKIIFGSSGKEAESFNQKHRTYTQSDIKQIMEYQKKNKLSNLQVSNEFKMSRNTISKWKKIYAE